MHIGAQRWLAWCGPVSLLVFFIGFWPFGHFLPPLAPSASAAEIAAFFREHAIGIRINSITVLLAMPLLGCFYASIAVQLRRIEGPIAPLATAQIITGTLAVVPFVPGAIAWAVAAYRPERSDELIYMLSDFGWITLFMTGAAAMVQFFVIGGAVLADKRPVPILPRWFGYFCFAASLMGNIPGWLVVLFKHGPFAWNGLFAFWVAVNVFGIWTIVASWVILAAIKRQALEGDTVSEAAA